MNKAERLLRTKRIINRRAYKASWLGWNTEFPHVFYKTKVGGCNNTRCYLCHGDKLLGKKTIKYRKELLNYRDMLNEI